VPLLAGPLLTPHARLEPHPSTRCQSRGPWLPSYLLETSVVSLSPVCNHLSCHEVSRRQLAILLLSDNAGYQSAPGRHVPHRARYILSAASHHHGVGAALAMPAHS
jgi:hypothetical protein